MRSVARVFCLAVVVSLLVAAPAFAGLNPNVSPWPLIPVGVGDQIWITSGDGTVGGGEFHISVWNGAFYDAHEFETFCIERNEDLSGLPFIVDSIERYAVKGGIAGQDPSGSDMDPISDETAFLYQNFYLGTLAKYDYEDDGGVGEFSTREDSANELQNAFWMLEDELAVASNYYYDLATAAVAGGQWSGIGAVRALNIIDPDTGEHKQTLLTMVPEASAIALWCVVGGVFGIGCWFRRRRQIPE